MKFLTKQLKRKRREPKFIPASEHGLRPEQFGSEVVHILKVLQEHGFEAYVVGGGIRDLLASVRPKDFDVVTDARPEQVKDLFPRSLLIGRRFRLVHVRFGRGQYIEVTTFRGNATWKHCRKRMFSLNPSGQITRDNVYGDIESDSKRRDLTINALYYNFKTGMIEDYVGGYQDLKEKRFVMLGEPITRFKEDPVRVLRVLRLQAKLGFKLNQDLKEAVEQSGPGTFDIVPERLSLEVLKCFHGGYGLKAFQALKDYGWFDHCFPATAHHLRKDRDAATLIERALFHTDQRVNKGLPVNGAFLFALFLWHPKQQKKAWRHALHVLKHQHGITSISQRMQEQILLIWRMQPIFIRRNRRKIDDLLSHPRWRLVYDFFLLRATVEPELSEHALWWTEYVEADESQREIIWQREVREPS